MTNALANGHQSASLLTHRDRKPADRRRVVAATAGLLAWAGAAAAGQADVCYSAPTTTGQTDRLTSSTPLECPQAGRHSLSQLAQAGWTIAAIQPAVVDYSIDPATHTPTSATAWQVVIEKEAK